MSHEPEQYTAGEAVRATGLALVGIAGAMVGLNPEKLVGRRIDRLQANAKLREAEDVAAQAAKAAEELKARIAKRNR